jgi:hypothetical protein
MREPLVIWSKREIWSLSRNSCVTPSHLGRISRVSVIQNSCTIWLSQVSNARGGLWITLFAPIRSRPKFFACLTNALADWRKISVVSSETNSGQGKARRHNKKQSHFQPGGPPQLDVQARIAGRKAVSALRNGRPCLPLFSCSYTIKNAPELGGVFSALKRFVQS